MKYVLTYIRERDTGKGNGELNFVADSDAKAIEIAGSHIKASPITKPTLVNMTEKTRSNLLPCWDHPDGTSHYEQRSGEVRRVIATITIFVEHKNRNMWTDEDSGGGTEKRIFTKDRRGCNHPKVTDGTCDGCGFDYDEYV